MGGFTVGFADNTITIDTPQIEPPEPSETPTASTDDLPPLNDCYAYTMDDYLAVFNIDGKYYLDVMNLLAARNLDYHKFDKNYMINYGGYCDLVSLDYYQNVVIPNVREFMRD